MPPKLRAAHQLRADSSVAQTPPDVLSLLSALPTSLLSSSFNLSTALHAEDVVLLLTELYWEAQIYTRMQIIQAYRNFVQRQLRACHVMLLWKCLRKGSKSTSSNLSTLLAPRSVVLCQFCLGDNTHKIAYPSQNCTVQKHRWVTGPHWLVFPSLWPWWLSVLLVQSTVARKGLDNIQMFWWVNTSKLLTASHPKFPALTRIPLLNLTAQIYLQKLNLTQRSLSQPEMLYSYCRSSTAGLRSTEWA